MKKGFIATLLAYLLIICSIPTNVFAEFKAKEDKYSYKENFYALTAMQYKDKTIVSGWDDLFVVDKFGNKTDLEHDYYYLSGDKALTTDMTSLELGFYQDEWGSTGEYSYNFSTGKEIEIYGDADGYNKIKTTVIDYYENLLETDLSDYKLINKEEAKELAKQKNLSGKEMYFEIMDMAYEGNNVYYTIGMEDENGDWSFENGLYKDGQVYRDGLSDLFDPNMEYVDISELIETKDGLFVFTYESEDAYDLSICTNRVYYRDNSGNSKVLIDSSKYDYMTMSYINNNYIVIDGILDYNSRDENEKYIFKKNSKGEYDLVKTLNKGYRVQPSEDNNIYLLKGDRGESQELYKFADNNVVKIKEFDEFYILNMHIYDNLNMALIGEDDIEDSYSDIWFANIVKEQQGWVNTNGKWYYYNNGVMQKGWLKDGSKWYYLNSGGDMATGWKKVDGRWYYMYSSGVMATNTVIDGWKIDKNGVGTKIK